MKRSEKHWNVAQIGSVKEGCVFMRWIGREPDYTRRQHEYFADSDGNVK
jgi:hypothetical protein